MLTKELENLSIAVTVVIAIVTLAGFMANVHPALDQLCSFRHVYIMMALPTALSLAWRKRAIAIVAFLTVVPNSIEVSPYTPSIADAEPCEANLKVMPINAFGPLSDHDALLELVDREQPDILFVSELRKGLKDRIATRFDHHVWKPKPYENFGLFSKYPILEWRYMEAPNGRPTIDAVVDTPHGRLRVLAAHPSAPFDIEAMHNRNAALKQIADAARASTEPAVVLGDLNVTVFSPHYKQIEAAGMTNARQGRGVYGTWPDKLPVRIPIDHVLVSDELRTCGMHVGDSFGSDHLPLVATIQF